MINRKSTFDKKLKIGWFGNRECFFNNFTYIKNALSNTHYWLFEELIKRGHKIYYVGKLTGTFNKDMKLLDIANIQAWQNFELGDANALRFTKTPMYCKSLYNYFSKTCINDEWNRIGVSWEEARVPEVLDRKLQEHLNDKFFPEEELDVIFVDNIFNTRNLTCSMHLLALMRKYPNAEVFIYDEYGEVSATFDGRLQFTEADLKRIIILGTYAREVRYVDLPFKGVESFFYCFVNKYLPINENPPYDTIYIGRMIDSRKKQYEELFDNQDICKIKVDTDFNLAKVTNGDIKFLKDVVDENDVKLLKQKKTLQYQFYEKYKKITWNMCYTLPCNLYEEYNNCRFTYIPLTKHRASIGLITLRPWEAATSGIIAVYNMPFYHWEEFTRKEFIVTDSNPLDVIIKRILNMSKNEFAEVIEETRKKLELYTADKLATRFLKIYNFYKSSSKETVLINTKEESKIESDD